MFKQVINQKNERRVTCLDWPLILLRDCESAKWAGASILRWPGSARASPARRPRSRAFRAMRGKGFATQIAASPAPDRAPYGAIQFTYGEAKVRLRCAGRHQRIQLRLNPSRRLSSAFDLFFTGQLERRLQKSFRRQQNPHPIRQPDTMAVKAVSATTHDDGRNVGLPWLRS